MYFKQVVFLHLKHSCRFYISVDYPNANVSQLTTLLKNVLATNEQFDVSPPEHSEQNQDINFTQGGRFYWDIPDGIFFVLTVVFTIGKLVKCRSIYNDLGGEARIQLKCGAQAKLNVEGCGLWV